MAAISTTGDDSPLLPEIELSTFAFLVQCANLAARPLLSRNQRWIQPGYEEPIETTAPSSLDESGSNRPTPATDDKPSAWLFPAWNPQRPWYTFGTSKCDIVLPGGKQVSRKHFALHLGQDNNWIVVNLSRFGTWVNGDLLGSLHDGDVQTQSALNPTGPNEIQAGTFECMIHPQSHALVDNHDSTLTTFLGLDLQSHGSQSTPAGHSDSTSGPNRVQTHAYHFLGQKPIDVQSDRDVAIAIRKRSGQNCISKHYPTTQKDKGLYQFKANPGYIVPYDEFIDDGDSSIIITPHLDAMTVDDLIGDQHSSLGVEVSFLVYKHIASALRALEKNLLIHNDISMKTILVEYRSGKYTAYLTGFSEVTTAERGSKDGFIRDIADLSSVIKNMLPVVEGHACCDPVFAELLSSGRAGRLSAAQVCLGLETMAPSYQGSLFKTATLQKTMSIRRIVDENGTEAVRLLDFVKIVLHHDSGRLKDKKIAIINKILRKEVLFQVENETYCYLHDAEKLIHHLNKDGYSLLLDLEPPKHTEACWYDTEHSMCVAITYHEPSGMVNITQILNLLENEVVQRCLEGIEPSFQEVRGSPKWEGFYLDGESARKIVQRLDLTIDQLPTSLPVLPPLGIPFGNSKEHDIIVATEEMIGTILVNSDGKTVRWGMETQELSTAVSNCEANGLTLAKSTILGIEMPLENIWTSRCTDDDIMNLFDQLEYPTEATSHNSFDDFKDSMRFIPRKRRGSTSVPLLPQRTMPLAEQLTPGSRREEIVSEGPPIRQTRFQSGSSSQAHPEKRRKG